MLEPARRGRVHPDAARLPATAPRALRPTRISTSTTRCRAASADRPGWAIEHYGVEPDLLVSGKSLGGGLLLAGVTGRAEVVDAVGPGGLGGTFGGTPSPAPRRWPSSTRSSPSPSSSARASWASGSGGARRHRHARRRAVGEVRGSGRCSRSSSSRTVRPRFRSRPRRRDRRAARARSRAPLVRPVRERHPHPRPAGDRRRGSRCRPRAPRGVARRRLGERLTPGSGILPATAARGRGTVGQGVRGLRGGAGRGALRAPRRALPGRPRRHVPARQGVRRADGRADVPYYAEWEFPDMDAFKAAARRRSSWPPGRTPWRWAFFQALRHRRMSEPEYPAPSDPADLGFEAIVYEKAPRATITLNRPGGSERLRLPHAARDRAGRGGRFLGRRSGWSWSRAPGAFCVAT